MFMVLLKNSAREGLIYKKTCYKANAGDGLASSSIQAIAYTNNNKISDVCTHGGLILPYGSIDLTLHGSGNGLLPDGTKPFYMNQWWFHQSGPTAFT